MTDDILTVEDVAKTLRVTPQRVRDLIREGTIPASRFGKRWFVRGSDLVATIFGPERQPEIGPAWKRGARL